MYIKLEKKLPKTQRKDVENELRSLLQDMVEDRAQTKIEKADEDIVKDVLLEFGSPETVAASYRDDKQFLIGPQLLPTFKLALMLITMAIAGLWLLGIVVAAFGSSENVLLKFVSLTINSIPEFANSFIGILGVVVVIFGIVERVLPEESTKEEAEWNPRDLPEINDSTQINRVDLIISSFFTIALLVYLNGFSEPAMMKVEDGKMFFVPMMSLSPHFYESLLPWLNLLLASCLGVNLYQLFLGRKTITVKWMEIGTTLLTAVVAYIFLTNGPIFGFASEFIVELQSNAAEPVAALDSVETLNQLLNSVIRVILIATVFIELFSAGKKIFQLTQEPNRNTESELVGKMG